MKEKSTLKDVANNYLTHTKTNEGITLIALVITIIVLLILAGVAIDIVFNQDNLFSRANEAVSKWNTSQQKEQNELNNIIYELQSLFKTEVTDNVLMEKSPSTWTDGNVTITLSYENIPAGYVIEYKMGEGEWTEGTSVIVTENNTTVYARLYNKSVDHETGTNSTTVSTIDREAPTAPTGITSSSTINSITVTGSGGTDVGSGVAGYKYSIDNINWTETIEEGKSYTYNGIKANTEVTIYAKTVDNLGKESSSYSTKVKTSQISSKVSFSKSINVWTSGNVTVTLSHSSIPSGYVLQYKIGSGGWTTGTTATVTANNTTVMGRLYNNTLNDEIASNSVTIGNIDKIAPTAPTGITNSSTTNSITVTASGGTDSLSGVAGYKYSIDNINWTETIEEGKSYTYNGIKANTEVTIYAKTVDNLGKESSSYSTKVKTSQISSKVSFSKSINVWTSGNVTVTLSHSSIPSGYVLQYKIGSGGWTTGTTATVTANNTTVMGRLYNNTLNDEIASNSVTIGNIDKIAPTAPTGITNSSTTNSITVTASGGTDSLSGVAGYQYNINGTGWSGTIGVGASYQFSSLAGGTNYTIYARTVDNTGTASSAYSKIVKTATLTAINRQMSACWYEDIAYVHTSDQNVETIDLTGISKIQLTYLGSTWDTGRPPDYYYGSQAQAAIRLNNQDYLGCVLDGVEHTATLDVSNLTGSVNISVHFVHVCMGVNLHIYNVVLYP